MWPCSLKMLSNTIARAWYIRDFPEPVGRFTNTFCFLDHELFNRNLLVRIKARDFESWPRSKKSFIECRYHDFCTSGDYGTIKRDTAAKETILGYALQRFLKFLLTSPRTGTRSRGSRVLFIRFFSCALNGIDRRDKVWSIGRQSFRETFRSSKGSSLNVGLQSKSWKTSW